MKVTRFLLSICCAAAVLTACSKAENKAKVVETHPVTLTIDLDNALTKTTFSYDSENHKWIQNWKDGDALSVIVQNETSTVNEKFVLVSGAGTKTGVFYCGSSTIPTSGTSYAFGIYPYSNNLDGNWVLEDFSNQGTGSLDNLGKYVIIRSKMIFEDGNFNGYLSGWKPEVGSFILKLPAGLKLVDGESGDKTVNITISDNFNDKLINILSYRSNGSLQPDFDNGPISLTGISLKNGVLEKETYIAGACISDFKKFTLTVSDGVNKIDYVLERTSDISTGNLYVIKQELITPKSF